MSRLDRKHYLANEHPIFHIVSKQEEHEIGYVNLGESSFYSLLFVDDNNILQKVDPNINETSIAPRCSCCTHTFNGKQFTQKYKV